MAYRWTGAEPGAFARFVWPGASPPLALILVAMTALGIVFATLSYYLVERNFLRLKDWHRGVRTSVPARGVRRAPGPTPTRALSSGDGPAPEVAHPAHETNGAEPDAGARALGRRS
jgi:hypothetical protein